MNWQLIPAQDTKWCEHLSVVTPTVAHKARWFNSASKVANYLCHEHLLGDYTGIPFNPQDWEPSGAAYLCTASHHAELRERNIFTHPSSPDEYCRMRATHAIGGAAPTGTLSRTTPTGKISGFVNPMGFLWHTTSLCDRHWEEWITRRGPVERIPNPEAVDAYLELLAAMKGAR